MMRKAGWEGKEGEELVGSKAREKSEVLGELLRDGAHALLVVVGVGGHIGCELEMVKECADDGQDSISTQRHTRSFSKPSWILSRRSGQRNTPTA